MLHIAVEYGREQVVSELLEKGANPDVAQTKVEINKH